MMNAIVISIRFLFSHKWKIILTLLMTVAFVVILFPLSELNDLISSQVSKLTGNRVFLQLEKMHLNPLSASISFENIYIETPQISSLGSDELEISPSFSALLAKKPGGKITAKGFLKGDVEVSIHPTSSAEGLDKSADKFKIGVVAGKINLKELQQTVNINLPIKGELNLTAQAVADLAMTEQPELDISMTILKFELASTSIPLQDFGQIALPEMKLGKIELKGRLSNGKFLIENGKLGTNQDEFYGDVKGDLSVTFQNNNGQINPIIGAYNISLDLFATQIFKDKAKLFLSFLDGYKIDSGSVSNYKFKVYSAQMGMPPQFTPLR
ncbi:MAG: type II secretion system protein GspN [Bdellovibrionota bacterium]